MDIQYSILVQCDLVGGSYLNGEEVPVIHSFFPSVDPGDKIIERPVEYICDPEFEKVQAHISSVVHTAHSHIEQPHENA